MAVFDTVIRNALVGTAADVFAADIAISGGVITALGRSLGPARHDIDAAGRYVHHHNGALAARDGEDGDDLRSEEHTSELQSLAYLVCRLLLEKKKTEKLMTVLTEPVLGPALTERPRRRFLAHLLISKAFSASALDSS